MAIPVDSVTERTLYLRSIVERAGMQEVFGWNRPSDTDLAVFGRIITLYSTIDFMLRFVAELMDDLGMLQGKWAGKKQAFSMASVTAAVRSTAIWRESHNNAFDAIERHRAARNVLAHFVIKQFPTEDAYICMTKSASDFEQVFGLRPQTEDMLYGVMDATQLRDVVPEVERLAKWVSTLPEMFANPLQPEV